MAIKVGGWGELPVGTWLVRLTDNEYHVAVVTENINGRFIIVGGHFHFDMGDVAAYAPFEKF